MSEIFVPRLYRQISPQPEGDAPGLSNLDTFLENRLLVVLGPPGMGKSTAFRRAAEADAAAEFVPIGKFLALNPERWRGRTLYLDGLDEYRASRGSDQNVMEGLVNRLDEVKATAVRLSCRSADWMEGVDLTYLRFLETEPVVLDLQPLTDEGIAAIAAHALGVEAGAALIAEARERDLADLLDNPQTLTMILTVAREDGALPDGKRALYARTADLLIAEANETHQRAQQEAARESDVAAADHLAACMLLSGQERLKLTGADPDAEHPALSSLPDLPPAAPIAARRRVFPAAGPERIGLPHRTVAEFMAARFLAGRIRDGLPVARVMALLTGFDGRPAAALRGVFGWLVTLLPPDLAATVLDRDPYGAFVNGDAWEWSEQTRIAAFQALRRLAERDPYFFRGWSGRPFASLAVPALAEELSEVLREGDETHLSSLVLAALAEGGALPQVADTLLVFIKDERQDVFLRSKVPPAFMAAAPERAADLRQVLDDVHQQRLGDSLNELRAALLKALYPAYLRPEELPAYLCVEPARAYSGSFDHYLSRRLLESVPEDQIAPLLDAIAVADRHFFLRHGTGLLPLRLIGRYFREIGPPTAQQLFRWLHWLTRRTQPNWDSDEGQRLGDYIRSDATLAMDILRLWIQDHREDEGFSIWHFRHFLPLAFWPTGFSDRLLRFALEIPASSLRVQVLELALERAAREVPRVLSLEDFEERLRDIPELHEALSSWGFQKLSEDYFEDAIEGLPWKTREADEQAALIEAVKARLEPVRQGRDLDVLRHFAGCWFTRSRDEANNADGPVAHFAATADEASAREVATGLVAALHRDDLPSARAFGEEAPATQGLEVLLRGAMDVLAATQPADVTKWPHRAAALAYVLELTEARSFESPPPENWPETVVRTWPEIVAETMQAFWEGGLEADPSGCPRGLHRQIWPNGLDDSPLVPVARRLLAAHPQGHPHMLKVLAVILFRHERLDIIHDVADAALSQVLELETPAIWHTFAAFADHQAGFESLSRMLKGCDDLKWPALETTDVLLFGAGVSIKPAKWRASLKLLLPRFENLRREPGGFRTGPRDPAEAAGFLRRLIRTVAADPALESGACLAALRADPALASWHATLSHHITEQAEVRRNATFAAPSLPAVARALGGGAPASVPDLRAFLVDLLADLQADYRSGAMDGWKGFWNLDSHGRPTDPLVEEACRNHLGFHLIERLRPLDVAVDRENQLAGQKRPDLQLRLPSVGKLPIEVKRQQHDDLWTAASDQLDRQYCQDPETQGQGLYLVFWFGAETPMPRHPDGLPRPKTPKALRDALLACLTDDQRARLSVVVLDVSPTR